VPGPPPLSQACSRHPDRLTGLSCVRCGRPFCPQCLREASVGYQCVECVGAARPETYRRHGGRSGTGGWPRPRSARTIAGATEPGRPLVVPALIALNTVIFLWTVVQAGSFANNAGAQLFEEWTLRADQVAAGEWWRLVTAGFLHFGLIHLAFNMIALWVIGKELEPVFGRVRFLAVYLVGLLGGSAAVILFGSPYVQVAGASGAVFGLMGALAVVLRRMRLSARPAVTLIVLNLVLSFVVPNISILGHLGGLVSGAVASALLVYAPARGRAGWQAAGIVALVAVLVLVMQLRAVALASM
jgi:membrane associated rhomboid family serine protease